MSVKARSCNYIKSTFVQNAVDVATMALPKISSRPSTTRLSRSTPSISVSNIYQVYPKYLPPAPEIPHKVNVLFPPPPQKRTTMWETMSPHWTNEQRTNKMKQRDYLRYHNTWSKYYYGSPEEQEDHRKYIRTVLKQQMTDKWSQDRSSFSDRVKESEDAVRNDQQWRDDDHKTRTAKHRFMTTYRDDNKRFMESAWEERKYRKLETDFFDREQLKYNPINWSATLK